MKSILLAAALFLAGCCPLRGYKLAGGTGDPTHVLEPGARVIVPKDPNHPPKSAKKLAQPKYVASLHRPNLNCIEVDHKVGAQVRTWACP